MKLRVIAGALGGRFFEAPLGKATHPMSERVRSALFNSLGDIKGLTILDAFAGSGALGIEAVSRGAGHTLMLENNKHAQAYVEKNITALSLSGKIRLIKANCRMWSERNPDIKFDLILVDPPYWNMQLSTINLLTKHLKPNGLMVLSYPGRGETPAVSGVVVVDTKLYGDAALAFYRQRTPK